MTEEIYEFISLSIEVPYELDVEEITKPPRRMACMGLRLEMICKGHKGCCPFCEFL